MPSRKRKKEPCKPDTCTCSYEDVEYPSLVRCTSPVCQMPAMTLETLDDARHWVRIHFLSGCQNTKMEMRPKAEIEAHYQQLAEQGKHQHWELWFDAEERLLTADVYTGGPLRPTQFQASREENDTRGVWRLVVPHATMDGAHTLARKVLRRAKGMP